MLASDWPENILGLIRNAYGEFFCSFPPWCDRIGSHSGSHRNYHIRKVNWKWSRTLTTRIAILVSQSNCVYIQWRYKWCRAVSNILVDSFSTFHLHISLQYHPGIKNIPFSSSSLTMPHKLWSQVFAIYLFLRLLS